MDLFLEWMFPKHAVSQPLIADGHKSHLTIDVIDLHHEKMTFFFSVYHHPLNTAKTIRYSKSTLHEHLAFPTLNASARQAVAAAEPL